MNRYGGKFFLLLLTLAVAGLVLYSPAIRSFFSAFASSIQTLYLDAVHAVDAAVERHTRQARRIEILHEKVRFLQHETLVLRAQTSQYRNMIRALGVTPEVNATIYPVPAMGYAKLGDFQQVWLETFPGYDPLKNYGVIHKGFAVGIVVAQKHRPLMILAGDKSCSFAVYIGHVRAPGIATGEDARHMVVRYIPEWMKIERGDEVVTSGLDRIFPPGVPVGRVLSIRKMQGFKNARIEIFGDTLHPDFVWVTARARPMLKKR